MRHADRLIDKHELQVHVCGSDRNKKKPECQDVKLDSKERNTGMPIMLSNWDCDKEA